MEVLKFGGTSVGSAYGLSCVRNLVESKDGEVVVVVSALGGATDMLLRISKIASEDGDYFSELNSLKIRHLQAIEDSVCEQHRSATKEVILSTFGELERILASVAVIGEISAKTSDLIVSFGERLSAPIVTGIFEDAAMLQAMDLFVTKRFYDKHVIDFCATADRLSKLRLEKRINVCSGFISKDLDGKLITNLGRGGSDYTAAIIASIMGATVLEIFTDVDGFLTADPRVVEKATLIEKLDFFDAIELCNYGAKVIYSPTIFPAFHKGVEIKIRNTFNAPCMGSSISNDRQSGMITGISSVNDLSLIRFVGDLNGLRYRLYKVLGGCGVEIVFGSGDFFGVHSKDVKAALNMLEAEFSQELAMGRLNKIEIINNLAMVAMVGMFEDEVAIKSQVMKVLEKVRINVVNFGADCSGRVVTFVVPIESVRGAIVAVHELIDAPQNEEQEIHTDILEKTVDRLKKAGDTIINITQNKDFAFIQTSRYREFPLRIQLN